MNPTTKTDDREQWRARIQRALVELQSDIPGIECGGPSEESESDGTSSATEV